MVSGKLQHRLDAAIAAHPDLSIDPYAASERILAEF